MKRLEECLKNENGRYMLPFLWLHGESHEALYEEILAIKNSGIEEFCAESRPYENFCEEQWWIDFGFILESARKLGMKVWLLDDKKFPTGYANGYLSDPSRVHLKKKNIRERQSDVVGPLKKARINVCGWLSEDEELVGVVAYKHNDGDEGLDFDTAVDLLPFMDDGTVYWDIPDGVWRVCVSILTGTNVDPKKRHHYYIDMLQPESCKAMIEAVYEPHYKHFGEYFGNTFVGFFSDEPGFLNKSGTYGNKLGIMYEQYPWRSDLPEMIAKSSGLDVEAARLAIPSLWEDVGGVKHTFRMHYMEVITKLYRENFSMVLGDWCRAHGVMYIGHVIEDMGANMRLAYGSGHFFRALDGQDMAGIDIVLQQDVPGIYECIHRAPIADGGIADPAFFRYTLPKLAASHSHIQPLKKGRAMCEIFGAFGWAEGLPFMKGLADVMIASGVNHFVPHAFSPKREDPDCPPHFYNGGRNVQYPLFKELIAYMNRSVHVLYGGDHISDVAVFYNAEGEWSAGKNTVFHSICKDLTAKQIDYDIIPFDYIEGADVENGALKINRETYKALIISESELLPYDRLKCFSELSRKGVSVIFTDSLPRASVEGIDISDLLADFVAIPQAILPDYLYELDIPDIKCLGNGTNALRAYHVVNGGKDVYLFSNEAVRKDIDFKVRFRRSGNVTVYDPWCNRCFAAKCEENELRLVLEKGNMLFAIFDDEAKNGLPAYSFEAERLILDMHFDVYVRPEGEEEFSLIAKDAEPFDISAPGGDTRFSGEIMYISHLAGVDGFDAIDLGDVGETAELWINGKYVGARINAPYKFSIKGLLTDGPNELKVIVRANPGHKRRDSFSRFIWMPPSGITGDIALCRYETAGKC